MHYLCGVVSEIMIVYPIIFMHLAGIIPHISMDISRKLFLYFYIRIYQYNKHICQILFKFRNFWCSYEFLNMVGISLFLV